MGPLLAFFVVSWVATGRLGALAPEPNTLAEDGESPPKKLSKKVQAQPQPARAVRPTRCTCEEGLVLDMIRRMGIAAEDFCIINPPFVGGI